MSFIPEDKGFFGRMADKVTGVFVPPPDPKEVVKNWTRQIRAESRGIDKNIRELDREKRKATLQIKQYAKAQNLAAARIVAKEMVNANKATTRLYTQKAHMLEMEMALKHQLAMVKVAGALQKSGDVMKIVNDMMKIGQMQGAMRDMAREMMKAGLIEEMMTDVMDDVTEAQEEEIDVEVNKVLHEVAGEELAALPTAGKAQLAPAKEQTEEEKAEEFELLQKLAAGQVPQAMQS